MKWLTIFFMILLLILVACTNIEQKENFNPENTKEVVYCLSRGNPVYEKPTCYGRYQDTQCSGTTHGCCLNEISHRTLEECEKERDTIKPEVAFFEIKPTSTDWGSISTDLCNGEFKKKINTTDFNCEIKSIQKLWDSTKEDIYYSIACECRYYK